MAAKDTTDEQRKDGDDGDVLDMSQAAVKKMIADAREQGLHHLRPVKRAYLPPDQVSSDQIEDVMSMLSEMGIQGHRGRRIRRRSRRTARANPQRSSTACDQSRDVALGGAPNTEKLDRTDDPVRMYLARDGQC